MSTAKRTPSVLSVGQLARAFGVAPRTASDWIDKGLCKGWRIPGSRDRRVTLAEAIAFAEREGLPTDALQEHAPGLLCCTADRELFQELLAAWAHHLTVSWASNLFLAGVAANRRRWPAILIDGSLGRFEADLLLAALPEMLPQAQLAILLTEDGRPPLTDAQADACALVRQRPVDVGELARELARLAQTQPPQHFRRNGQRNGHQEDQR